jgi:hypothetical protein
MSNIHLLPRELARLNYEHGWKDANNLLISVSVEIAEGNGYTEAVHINDDAVLDAEGNVITPASEDWGLWQINNRAHPSVTKAQAFDPAWATRFARQLYADTGNSFRAWAAYNNGAWKGERALGYALDGVRNYLAVKHGVYGVY